MTVLVRDVMTTKVVTISSTTPFKEIVEAMRTHCVSALPVVDEHSALAGIVSEADMLLKEEFPRSGDGGRFDGSPGIPEQIKAAATCAGDIMTKDVVTVDPHSSLRAAVAAMRHHNVKRLPVVDRAGRLCGIVSRGDLLSVFLRSDEAIEREIVRDVIEKALWLDASHVRVEVHEGEVYLTGDIDRRSVADVLVRLCYSVDGVVVVHPWIRVEKEDATIGARKG